MDTTLPSTTRRRVERVTLPRYDVAYPSPDDALADALQVRNDAVLIFDEALPVAVGSDVVLDFRAGDLPIQATLLFRVIQHIAGRTLLEFWPRRATDPDVLEIWIEALRLEKEAKDAPQVASLAPNELQDLFALCRRMLSTNPFVALDVHWSAPSEDFVVAYTRLDQQLRMYGEHAELSGRAREFVDRALMRLPMVWEQVGTRESRKLARAKYVTSPQIAIAREMAREKLELARMRQDGVAIEVASALVDELSPA